MIEISEILALAVKKNASDVHLLDSQPPSLRIDGELQFLMMYPEQTTAEIEEMVFSIVDPVQKELLINNREIDFSTKLPSENGNFTRFRVNAYYQKGTLSAAFRVIPDKIKTIEELKLPPILTEFTKVRQGFILLTGGSGQGKSTTIAALIQEINKTRKAHIISIEDPIEYIFPKAKALVSQREMYQDTHSWSNALRSILREDPDVVFIGEMRDPETISSALTIAETGHLVLSTLHTNSSSQCIDRILDIFPSGAKQQVKMQLSMVLTGVVTQKLVPCIMGGRIPVCEILLGTSPVKNSIREGNTHLIDNIIQTSRESGMLLFEDHLKELVNLNLISHEIAISYALRPDRYQNLMKG
jgi:twitching motility protein PilT